MIFSTFQGSSDVELLNLILIKNLTPHVVSSPIYASLVTHLLQTESEDDLSAAPLPEGVTPEAVCHQLRDAGHLAEAGSLLICSKSSHTGLQTFSTALAAVGRWLNKS